MIKKNLGIQTYCYRKFPGINDLIGKLRENAIDSIELFNLHCNCRGNGAKEKIGQLKTAGINILGIGVEFMGQASDEKVFEYAKYAGTSYISVDFSIKGHLETIACLDRLAEKYDINVGIHNHGGSHWLDSPEVFRYIFAKTRRVGLCYDTAWSLDAHCNPQEIVKSFSDRIYAVHLKDFKFAPDGKGIDVIPGCGNLDLPMFFTELNKQNCNPDIIIEYEGDADNPVGKINECLNSLKKIWVI